MVLAEGFDFDIYTGRQIELHQRVNRLRRRVENIHQALVGANLKLFTRFLVHMRAAINRVFILHGGQRNRSRHTRARSLCRVNYLSS